MEVARIEVRAGCLVRNALRDRFGAAQGGRGEGNRFRLDVRLEDSITGFGVRTDDSVTRERRTLRARYQLVDGATGAVLLDATAAPDAGIDLVGSESAPRPGSEERRVGEACARAWSYRLCMS